MQVPTIAIEYVYVWNNNSVMVDEVFSHRLGLIPWNVDPRLTQHEREPKRPGNRPEYDRLLNSKSSVRGIMPPHETLQILQSCTTTRKCWQDICSGFRRANRRKFFPHARQRLRFQRLSLYEAAPRPGDRNAVKGLGKGHAKFSPVGTW